MKIKNITEGVICVKCTDIQPGQTIEMEADKKEQELVNLVKAKYIEIN